MMSPGFAFVIALCLVQTAHSQILGLGNGVGCNNGFLPNALGPNALGPNVLGPNFGIAPGVGPLCYGDVAVTGELPVGGSTAVAGQVPVIGYVTFEGLIPAGGLVSVANGCGCNGVY